MIRHRLNRPTLERRISMRACVRRVIEEFDDLDANDQENLLRALFALHLARHPSELIFGFGGVRSMVNGAMDDITRVWERRYPETPVARRFWDDLLVVKNYDAFLAR